MNNSSKILNALMTAFLVVEKKNIFSNILRTGSTCLDLYNKGVIKLDCITYLMINMEKSIQNNMINYYHHRNNRIIRFAGQLSKIIK